LPGRFNHSESEVTSEMVYSALALVRQYHDWIYNSFAQKLKEQKTIPRELLQLPAAIQKKLMHTPYFPSKNMVTSAYLSMIENVEVFLELMATYSQNLKSQWAFIRNLRAFTIFIVELIKAIFRFKLLLDTGAILAYRNTPAREYLPDTIEEDPQLKLYTPDGKKRRKTLHMVKKYQHLKKKTITKSTRCSTNLTHTQYYHW